jgi:membrane-associated protease RseP (regulator of RpoE activity)
MGSMEDNPFEAVPLTPLPSPPARRPWRRWLFAKSRPWLNGLLFALTAASTFVVGLGWAASYAYAELLSRTPDYVLSKAELRTPRVVGLALLYAAALMVILAGHELGHYLTCRRYGIEATLPFFIPAPTLIGTMGAFIRIKAPVTRKRQLFDIGVAGPLTGFILALPALAVGLALSKTVPALPRESTIVFGDPLLLKLLARWIVGPLPPGYDLILHPVAFAGWVGALVTALNLFPIGQLDGGHVSYAVFGSKSKTLGRVFLAAFLAMGVVFWVGWLLWAGIILILGARHPRTWDEESPLGATRTALAALVALIFILTFIPDPVRGYNLLDVIKLF